ncbi:amidase [Polycladomyces subterraneus]|uniref:Amidase n=1 Tax=Polycladomyces subterraneus TaxID=1016997 RepID=A0ABT8IJV0_9BACL|nr:amidase [Polycladomyces subterraneus]MDN4593005.1 amidase [Polycladomyces subterraneus]
MAQKYKEDFLKWDLQTLSDGIRTKEISPLEVTRHLLKWIEVVNPKLNAFITVLYEEALESASQAEKEIVTGNWRGPLHGIPIGLKDIIYTKNIRTTMGSEIYKDFAPDYDAGVVEKLKQAGAIIIGKLNTHQFAYGPTGDRSYFGAVKNPYDLTKMSGGSSSGSGAAVSAGLCYAALGTDTGGSVRIPSACCGIVGMKPTFGRVSKYGVYPLSWTLDHVGPMTRTVFDNAVLLNVLAGYDERDPYSVKEAEEDFTRLIWSGVKGSVIGVPTSFYFENLEPEVESQIRKSLEVFEGLGAEIRMIDLPDMQKISLAQQITIRSESYAVHRETLLMGLERYEKEVRERLLLGKNIEAYEYVQSQQVKHYAQQEFRKVLEKVDVLVTPTLPILPPDIDQREVYIKGNCEHVRDALLRLTSPSNFIGFPSISIPCGFSEAGLPIGMQFIGRPFDEANLYRFAYAFEQEVSIPTLKYDVN